MDPRKRLPPSVVDRLRVGANANWSDRSDALRDLTAACGLCATESERSAFASELRALAHGLASCVDQPRSTLVKDVCATLSSLAPSLGPRLVECVGDAVIPALIRRASVRKQVMRLSAVAAATAMLRCGGGASSPRVLTFISHTVLDAKAPALVRATAAELLGVLLETAPGPTLSKMAESDLDAVIREGCTDANDDVRVHSRENFHTLARVDAARAARVLATLPTKVQALLRDAPSPAMLENGRPAPRRPPVKEAEVAAAAKAMRPRPRASIAMPRRRESREPGVKSKVAPAAAATESFARPSARPAARISMAFPPMRPEMLPRETGAARAPAAAKANPVRPPARQRAMSMMPPRAVPFSSRAVPPPAPFSSRSGPPAAPSAPAAAAGGGKRKLPPPRRSMMPGAIPFLPAFGIPASSSKESIEAAPTSTQSADAPTSTWKETVESGGFSSQSADVPTTSWTGSSSSPFADDDPPSASKSSFADDEPTPASKSPFADEKPPPAASPLLSLVSPSVANESESASRPENCSLGSPSNVGESETGSPSDDKRDGGNKFDVNSDDSVAAARPLSDTSSSAKSFGLSTIKNVFSGLVTDYVPSGASSPTRSSASSAAAPLVERPFFEDVEQKVESKVTFSGVDAVSDAAKPADKFDITQLLNSTVQDFHTPRRATKRAEKGRISFLLGDSVTPHPPKTDATNEVGGRAEDDAKGDEAAASTAEQLSAEPTILSPTEILANDLPMLSVSSLLYPPISEEVPPVSLLAQETSFPKKATALVPLETSSPKKSTSPLRARKPRKARGALALAPGIKRRHTPTKARRPTAGSNKENRGPGLVARPLYGSRRAVGARRFGHDLGAAAASSANIKPVARRPAGVKPKPSGLGALVEAVKRAEACRGLEWLQRVAATKSLMSACELLKGATLGPRLAERVSDVLASLVMDVHVRVVTHALDAAFFVLLHAGTSKALYSAFERRPALLRSVLARLADKREAPRITAGRVMSSFGVQFAVDQQIVLLVRSHERGSSRLAVTAAHIADTLSHSASARLAGRTLERVVDMVSEGTAHRLVDVRKAAAALGEQVCRSADRADLTAACEKRKVRLAMFS